MSPRASWVLLPHALPQIARWITGDAPSDDAFARRQDAFLAELLRRLGPQE